MKTILLFAAATAASAFAQAPPLENTRWRLLELDGRPQASPPGARQIYLRLADAPKRAEGFAGCNTFSGGYQIDGANLKFTGLVMTRMACPSLDIENRVSQALGGTTQYRIDEGRLTLLGENKNVLARFESDDPWSRVVALASGAEIRVARRGGGAALTTGVFDMADAEKLVIVVKNRQEAIPKKDVVRVEARPKGASRVTRTGGSTQNMPMDRPPAANPNERMRPVPPNSTSSTSSGLTIGGKPDFELVYQARP